MYLHYSEIFKIAKGFVKAFIVKRYCNYTEFHNFFLSLWLLWHFICRYDFVYKASYINRIIVHNAFEVFESFREPFFIKFNGVSDMDKVVFGIPETFFTHEKLFIKLFARTKTCKFNIDLFVGLISGKCNQLFTMGCSGAIEIGLKGKNLPLSTAW